MRCLTYLICISSWGSKLWYHKNHKMDHMMSYLLSVGPFSSHTNCKDVQKLPCCHTTLQLKNAKVAMFFSSAPFSPCDGNSGVPPATRETKRLATNAMAASTNERMQTRTFECLVLPGTRKPTSFKWMEMVISNQPFPEYTDLVKIIQLIANHL